MRIHDKALTGLLTVLMAVALLNAREWGDGRGRDSVMRITRGGQRLDAADAPPHGSDDAEIALTSQSVVVESPAIGLDGPSTASLPAAAPSFAAPVAAIVLQVRPIQLRPLVRATRPSLGRAPPLA